LATIQPSEIADSEAFAAEFKVSRETLARLNLYESELRRWQARINLVAPASLPNVWHRHFADSAQLLPLIPPNTRTLVDLGSGGGFPGLVLAILLAGEAEAAGRDPLGVTLVESDQRKCAFLREVARRAGVAVDILSIRIENPETQVKLPRVGVVTARALAPLDRLLALAFPLFSAETTGLFLKGQGVQPEIDAARSKWSFDVTLVPSVTASDAGITVIRNLKTLSGPSTKG